jgi:hypothetical protein
MNYKSDFYQSSRNKGSIIGNMRNKRQTDSNKDKNTSNYPSRKLLI